MWEGGGGLRTDQGHSTSMQFMCAIVMCDAIVREVVEFVCTCTMVWCRYTVSCNSELRIILPTAEYCVLVSNLILQKSIEINMISQGFYTKIICYLEVPNLKMSACHEGYEGPTACYVWQAGYVDYHREGLSLVGV